MIAGRWCNIPAMKWLSMIDTLEAAVTVSLTKKLWSGAESLGIWGRCHWNARGLEDGDGKGAGPILGDDDGVVFCPYVSRAISVRDPWVDRGL